MRSSFGFGNRARLIFSHLKYRLRAFYLDTSESDENHLITSHKYRRLIWKCHRVLSYMNEYYTGLSKKGKIRFLVRVIQALKTIKISGREGEVATIEKKIVLVGGLVQLTFGLKTFDLKRYKTIGLYPAKFYSRLIERNVKGLTYAKGLILISWLDTFKGFHNNEDNINLALHEWAHGFQIHHQRHQTSFYYARMTTLLRKLERHFTRLLPLKDSQTYLRNYAFTNSHEFFACSVEHFFETPNEFVLQYPVLFKDLCTLLNQNPLNKKWDYRLSK